MYSCFSAQAVNVIGWAFKLQADIVVGCNVGCSIFVHTGWIEEVIYNNVKVAAQRGGSLSFEELREHMISTPLANYAYQNSGGYRFEDKSEEWGFDFSGFSNGAALGDLDADGDLDIVVNNFFDPACVYENTATNIATNNYIRLKFEGPNR